MQIDSLPRYMNNMDPIAMTIPSPNAMDFDSDPIVPEFPSTFMTTTIAASSSNNSFMNNNKYNGSSNYSPIITDCAPNLNINQDTAGAAAAAADAEPSEAERRRRRINFESIQWSQMTFMYCKKNRRHHARIQFPTNFHYTPIPSSSQPFQYQPPPRPIHFGCNPLNEHMMNQLFKWERFFENKVVLELGSGFGVPSMVSLCLGAKHVYVTDGNEDITAILPAIMERNKIAPDQYTIKKLLYNNFSDLRAILKDCSGGVDIVLACDVLDTADTAINFYETISFYFESYRSQQKRRFIGKKQKELRDKKQQSRPHIGYQFNVISGATRYGGEDLNTPITNGGYLPLALKPVARRMATGAHPMRRKKSEMTDMLSILSRSDDDNSTNSTHNLNTELPNTTNTIELNEDNNNNNNAPRNKTRYKYKAPYLHLGVASLSAMQTIVNAQPLPLLAVTNASRARPRHVPMPRNKARILPKFKTLNDDDESEEDDEDADGDCVMMMDDERYCDEERKRLQLKEAEFAKYLTKSKANAPILILALSTRHKDVKLKDDPLNTFYAKCVSAGYRIQNVVREWHYQIWVVKA